MSGLVGLGWLVLVDGVVWLIAYRVQVPPTRIRVLGANVTVIAVNVALIVVSTFVQAVAP
jgi:hypothetical protein